MNLFRKLKPNGIAVTEISSQLWCEKQLLYGLTYGRQRTKVMKNGEERHTDLHKEVAELIEVTPRSIADVVAIQLNNCEAAVARLNELGFTRELPILGKLNTLFLRGSIDEVRLMNGELRIIDTKTRLKPTMPGEEQKNVSKFQLMVYWHMLNEIIERHFNFLDLLKFYRFNTKTKISQELFEEVKKLNPLFEENLYMIAKKAFSGMQSLPKVSKMLELRYEHQETRRPIGAVEFGFNDSFFKMTSDSLEEMWLGKREPGKAMESEPWKCAFCEFKDICHAP